MPKHKTARLIALDFIDEIMQRTVLAHEALCDKGECTLETPCPYCQINDIMMEALKKI